MLSHEQEIKLHEIWKRHTQTSKMEHGIHYVEDVRFLLELTKNLRYELEQRDMEPSAKEALDFVRDLNEIQNKYPMFIRRHVPVG